MWIEDSFFKRCFELKKDGLRALIAPEMGMTLIDFRVSDISLLDRSTEDDFLAYRKGLGPLILPHFNQNGYIPEKLDEKLFPHILVLREHGIKHPFQHGIARYVPWRVERVDEREDESSITGIITGEDRFSGIELKMLTGFNFVARVSYRLTSEGLFVAFDVRGEEPVVTGIHFYYDLVNRETAELEFMDSEGNRRVLGFGNREFDDVFIPGSKFGDYSTCTLKTESYKLDTVFKFRGLPEEVFESLVVFSPGDASFVCIEPLSYNPKGIATKRYNSGVILLRPVAL